MKDKFVKSLSINRKSKATMKSILFAMNHYSIFLGNKLEDSTEEQFFNYKTIINIATTEQDKDIISILYESGMRIGEFVAVKLPIAASCRV